MEDTKSLFMSKTFWGSVLVLAASACSMFGVDLGDPSGFADDIVAVIGAVLAIYGRFTAVKKIGAKVEEPKA